MKASLVLTLIITMSLVGVVSTYAQEPEIIIYSTPQEYEKLTGKKIVKFQESPMLRVKVAAGELPSVEKRLPEEPLVMKPLKEIGQYGGTLHSFTTYSNAGEAADLAEYPTLLSVDSKYRLVPNIAKKWEFSKDGKTLTIYLRKGMKWSDGVPFTADDIMFWWEDTQLNEDLSPGGPLSYYRPGGETMKVEKIDDYTVRFHFSLPYTIIENWLSVDTGPGANPKHYLKQFHIKYNPKANELAKEHGFNHWYEYFKDRAKLAWSLPYHPELPTLSSYIITERTTTYCSYERNPYYWKIDIQGNQLPYIDKYFETFVSDQQVYAAKIVTGEHDFALDATSLGDYPLYMKNAKKNNQKIYLWPGGWGSMVLLEFNQTCEDPVLRKIFQDVRFRRALSLAINRDEINKMVYKGLGIPRQMTMVPQSIYYEEKFGKAYANYDPEEANRLLDEMGLKWDKDHKYRLRPDGKILAFTIETTSTGVMQYEEKLKTAELTAHYWEKIGCKVDVKSYSRDLIDLRTSGNKMQAKVWHGDVTTDKAFPMQVGWFSGAYDNEAPLWQQWLDSNGEQGEEPPAEVKKNYERWKKAKFAKNQEERIKYAKELLESQAENLWTIGTVGMAPIPIVARANIENVMEKCLFTWDYFYTQPTHPDQFFFKKSK